eukprot:CAMPEP_0194561792 /NCGR_PEP_ID=MMETSP0292-20121207/2451_1 /TAXON_ID=39354 /ORGANISM="Heterosigma akashiwo, Strain CCMP2393" /LENGTH=179 /DNA_ID=CAMNT_0039410283 /DNA_START=59 /DNA_END=594 /DNA_ORIENTATION=-
MVDMNSVVTATKTVAAPLQFYVPFVESINLLAIWATFGILLFFNLIHYQCKRLENRLSPEELQLKKKLRALKIEKAKLSQISDFVEVSMLERKMIKIEKSLDASKAKRSAKRAWMSNSVVKVKKALMVGMAAVFWATPIVQFNEHAFWPVGRLLAFPGHERGAVAVLPWLYLVQKVVAG